LAILELLRHHSFRAEQPIDYGEIWILPPTMDAAAQSHPTADNASPSTP
jgi:segregation and condensation protein A